MKLSSRKFYMFENSIYHLLSSLGSICLTDFTTRNRSVYMFWKKMTSEKQVSYFIFKNCMMFSAKYQFSYLSSTILMGVCENIPQKTFHLTKIQKNAKFKTLEHICRNER